MTAMLNITSTLLCSLACREHESLAAAWGARQVMQRLSPMAAARAWEGRPGSGREALPAGP
jgi:hypothetical protein